MIVDYKNDYIDPEFLEVGNFEVCEIGGGKSLPFNPFEINLNTTKPIHPMKTIYSVLDVFERALGKDLTDPMQQALKKAMQVAYTERSNIDTKKNDYSAQELQDTIWPDFPLIMKYLDVSDTPASTLAALHSRLDKIVDLGYLPIATESISFEATTDKNIVISMKEVAGEGLKKLISQLIIMNYHGSILKSEGEHQFKSFLVFDEAHRIAEAKSIEDLIREARAFGLGLILGSQFPSDIPEKVSGNISTRLYLLQKLSGKKKELVDALADTNEQKAGLKSSIEALSVAEGFLKKQGQIIHLDFKPFNNISGALIEVHAYKL